jgi:D-psicose/D-tagatose/L-ribulose 3-epimerase
VRISISNIAWDAEEDDAVARVLCGAGVDAIDVAPGKYFPDIENTDDKSIELVRRYWSAYGIEITGMQALLFGAHGLNMFGDAASQEAMLRRLDAVCRIASGLGATRLVFGSPKNRDRGALSDAAVQTAAIAFFRKLGERAAHNGVSVCLEPNPAQYGANFMLDTATTAQVVRETNHPAIRLQLDTGAMTINGENPEEVLRSHCALIGHIHASEPDLVVLGDGGTDHYAIGRLLRARLPHHIVTIEMRPPVSEPRLNAIQRAVLLAVKAYRGDSLQ